MKKLGIICLVFVVIMCITACANTNQSGVSPSTQSNDQNSESDEYQILSISLSSVVTGSPVERTFTDLAEIDRIASLIIDQKELEDTDGLETPENAIVATIQDGPGTNFKLSLFPATAPKLDEDVLVIQGELFTFYTDIQAYEEIMSLLSSENSNISPNRANLSDEQRRSVVAAITNIIQKHEDGTVDISPQEATKQRFAPMPEDTRFPQNLNEEISSGIASFVVYEDANMGGYNVELLCSSENGPVFMVIGKSR